MENYTVNEGKTNAIISYFTIIGTIIALILNKDKKIQLKTYAPIEGEKKFSGIILDVKDKVLLLKYMDDCLELELANITQAKLVIEF